jgi:AraC family L-rhamnose operon regulatory protein RhaS
MHPRSAIFHAADQLHRADTCEPLVAAVAAGEVRLEALVRGTYPGRPLPDGVLPNVSSIGFWDATHDQTWGLGEHRNEGIEITYLDNGRLGFVVDERRYLLTPGHLTITRPWQPHRVGDPHVGASRLYWLILDVGVRQPHQPWRWPPGLVLTPADRTDLTEMLRENEHPVWPGTPEICRCFAEIGRLIELAGAGPLAASRLTLLVNELLVCVLELLRTQNPPRNVSLTLSERSVAMFLERLKNDPSDYWTLESMAEQAGLARTRFAHHCRKLTNLSPLDYLQHLRVEQAKRLLAETRHSITEIALECGFASSAYFASVFRRQTQSTPREYRDAAKKDQP